MGHSQAEKAESRERILDAAALKIRESGLDSLSIADLMKAANLTHGGFYGHFPSRAALIAAALVRAMNLGESAMGDHPDTVESFVERYLSEEHRDSIGIGCAVAALASDIGRLDDRDLREIMARRVEGYFESMAKAMGNGPGAEKAAVAAWCTMVGALAISRMFRGSRRADEILAYARQSILDLDSRVNPQARPGPGDGSVKQ
ncbi:MAG: TetR/AcrR family transcriptional regulator [Clostridiaceae bacterium]|nr:TetR/AcrR family transcriptional regulator [Clostridiaceae bacterium]